LGRFATIRRELARSRDKTLKQLLSDSRSTYGCSLGDWVRTFLTRNLSQTCKTIADERISDESDVMEHGLYSPVRILICDARDADIVLLLCLSTAGRPGDRGVDGVPGVQGPDGFTGSPGRQGLPGETGPQGPSGQPGAQGFTGPMGFTGGPGSPGNPGSLGRAGLPGVVGQPGFTGPQGPKGRVGQPGDVGPQGPRGPDGIAGERGIVGNRGLPGTLVESRRSTRTAQTSAKIMPALYCSNAAVSAAPIDVCDRTKTKLKENRMW